MLEIVRAILGPGAFVVRGLFFDKTLEANWNLPWHQDLTIAVQEREHVPGFGPWTVKAGIPHVHAPSELLERMVTIRLHLDDCDLENGPMRVLPGSHLAGKLDAAAIARWAVESRECALIASSAPAVRSSCGRCFCIARPRGREPAIAVSFISSTRPKGCLRG